MTAVYGGLQQVIIGLYKLLLASTGRFFCWPDLHLVSMETSGFGWRQNDKLQYYASPHQHLMPGHGWPLQALIGLNRLFYCCPKCCGIHGFHGEIPGFHQFWWHI